MSHALIIDDNMVISRAIEARLVPYGFDSFDRTWAERQATEAAAQHAPDLIVVGDSVAGGSPMEVARHIATSCNAPVLMVTSGRVHEDWDLQAGTRITGPFHVTQLDAALLSNGMAARELELCA